MHNIAVELNSWLHFKFWSKVTDTFLAVLHDRNVPDDFLCLMYKDSRKDNTEETSM